MTTISQSCVDAAMKYANEEQHEGEGYHLRLLLKNGNTVEGAVENPNPEFPNVVTIQALRVNDVLLKDTEPNFIEKSDIVSAAVIW